MKDWTKVFLFLFFLSLGTVGIVLGDQAGGIAVPAGTGQGAGATTQSTGSVAATPATPPQPGFMSMLFPFLLMFGIVYFLMIRPQQKKMKQHQQLLTGLSRGDDVVTASGLLGKVTGIADKVVTLEIAQNVRVKMLKNQITQIVKDPTRDFEAPAPTA